MNTCIGVVAPAYLALTGIPKQQAIFENHMKWAAQNLAEYSAFLLDKIDGANSFTVVMPKAEFLLPKCAQLIRDKRMLQLGLGVASVALLSSIALNIYQYCTRPKVQEEEN